MSEYRLFAGRKYTGIAVKSDEKWPSMWRIHRADGTISDMVNLTRAKDAALSAARLGGTEVPRWDYRADA